MHRVLHVNSNKIQKKINNFFVFEFIKIILSISYSVFRALHDEAIKLWGHVERCNSHLNLLALLGRSILAMLYMGISLLELARCGVLLSSQSVCMAHYNGALCVVNVGKGGKRPLCAMKAAWCEFRVVGAVIRIYHCCERVKALAVVVVRVVAVAACLHS